MCIKKQARELPSGQILGHSPFTNKRLSSRMQRDIPSLKSHEFDLLIIGAGSHGACAARDAALRGMRVALIDKGDICGATSHNSLKTIHGGIRYLQHLNFKRSLESIKEQKIWLRTAPHLVKPLPFLMPTYGHGLRGPAAMFAGTTLFGLLGIGRNKHLRDDRKLPRAHVMSKAKCLALAPSISQDKLTGGALWYDAQAEYADRAIMQITEQACELGSFAANYVQADTLLLDQGRVTGVSATDLLTGNQFHIRAKSVLNAAGPWASELLAPHSQLQTNVALSKSMNLVTSLPAPEAAVAVQSTLTSDSVVGTTKRLYFIVPWMGRTVVGTTHFNFTGKPDELSIEHDEVLAFVDEINTAYPSLNLTAEQVLYCYQGLQPAVDDHNVDDKNAMQLHESKIIDHAKPLKKTAPVEGLVSILSVKWTTARLVAQQAIDVIANKLGNTAACTTEYQPIEDALNLPHQIHGLSNNELNAFCHAHIEHSMTVNLTDLVLRRSNDLVLGRLTIEQLIVVARTLQKHFNWSHDQQARQLTMLLDCWLPTRLRQQLLQTPLWT